MNNRRHPYVLVDSYDRVHLESHFVTFVTCVCMRACNNTLQSKFELKHSAEMGQSLSLAYIFIQQLWLYTPCR